MTSTSRKATDRPLRVWPGVTGAAIALFPRVVPEAQVPGDGVTGALIGLIGAAIVILWWLFFSRARWPERIGGVLLIPIAALLTALVVHPSIGGELGGAMLITFLLPTTVPALLVTAAVLFQRSSRGARAVAVAAAILVGSGVWALARTEGIKGGANPQVRWRWTPTAEERLLTAPDTDALPAAPTAPAKPADAPANTAAAAPSNPAPRAAAPSASPVLWSGFRGAVRNSVVPGEIRISTDWRANPPVEVWRQRVGPGWSSLAVAGELVFTQEQRGDHEVIAAYRLRTGEAVWRHRDAARFWEPAAGAGPRGTPSVHDGLVYALGATGILNALDARTGARRWARNVGDDTGAPMPEWGFAGSPLVVGDALIVAASGRLAAYDLKTGTPRWTRKTTGGGYSSPHLATLAGVPQILLMNGSGITGVGLDGGILWANHVDEGLGVLQPAVLDDDELVVALGELLRGLGLRRLAVSRAPDGSWAAEERWSSRGLKPYFSDFVVHNGHAYGFDGTIMSAIDLDTGERVWKGGRYGAGQVLLLPRQDLLLVLSEEGELVLVGASPERHAEIARFKAIEGKTWNHPVLVGDLLLVRNGEEMAAFRLPR